jgi:hypothetical protein
MFVNSAESRASQYKHYDIEQAAAHFARGDRQEKAQSAWRLSKEHRPQSVLLQPHLPLTRRCRQTNEVRQTGLSSGVVSATMTTAATVRPSSTNSPTAMEAAALKSTAAGTSDASRSTRHAGPGLKAASRRSRSAVNPARIILASYVVGPWPPVVHVRAEVVVVVPAVTVASVAVSIKRRAIYVPG